MKRVILFNLSTFTTKILMKYYIKIFALIKEVAHTIYVKSMECSIVNRTNNNVATSHAIRTGNARAIDVAHPQLFLGPVLRNN